MAWLFGKKSGRPDARDVATRAVILRFVVFHGLTRIPPELRSTVMDPLPPAALKNAVREFESLRDKYWGELGSLAKHMTPWERSFSRTTCLDMEDQQQVDASWRADSLHVLFWALGRVPAIPRWDSEADLEALKSIRLSPFPEFVAMARLIEQDRIERARDTAELWNWRSRTRHLQAKGLPFHSDPALREAGLGSFEEVIRIAAKEAAEKGDIPPSIGGDFPALGKAYRDLTDDEWSLVSSIAQERHFALNWLCGMAPGNRWDETPTPT